MIDGYAGLRHYFDHIAPVWAALPPEARGTLFAPNDVVAWARRPTAPVAVEVVEVVEGFPDRRSTAPVLVAGFADHHAVRPRSTVLLNHGAGQTYLGAAGVRGHECYSGGPGRERVLLHLEPGPMAARASERSGQPYVAVGSPKLDAWHPGKWSYPSPMGPDVSMAFGFHHDGRGCPEQQSALPYYRKEIEVIAARRNRVKIIGHGHPRGWERTANWWAGIGIEPEPDFAQVLDRAAVYITDTSSTGVEFASTGRPVIFCSAPWYRRDVHHHGRFWTWTNHALHVEHPWELEDAIRAALSWPCSYAEQQRPMVEDVYCATDGKASLRAAAAIVALLAS